MWHRTFSHCAKARLGREILSSITGLLLLTLGGCGDSGSSSVASPSPDFIICTSVYALCTTSECSPIPGSEDSVSCDCSVMSGYSAGLTACQDVQETGQGAEILSRYFPVKSYAICANDRPWANCLDSPCLIDPLDPTQATCTCTIEQDQGRYVKIKEDEMYDASSCTTGIISSATLGGARQLTHYLRTHKTPLPAFPIKVFRPH